MVTRPRARGHCVLTGAPPSELSVGAASSVLPAFAVSLGSGRPRSRPHPRLSLQPLIGGLIRGRSTCGPTTVMLRVRSASVHANNMAVRR